MCIGPKRLETKNRPVIEKGQTTVDINETLSMLTTLYKDIKKGGFQERSAKIVIQLQKGEKTKSVGVARINLSDFIKDKLTISELKEIPLEKCPDKDAKVRFRIKATLIKETFSSGDAVSQMSDAVSYDSGPESEYDFSQLEDAKEEKPEGGRSLSGFRKKLGGNLGSRKPPSMVKIKASDQQKPPLVVKRISQFAPGSHNPNELIQSCNTNLIKSMGVTSALEVTQEANESSEVNDSNDSRIQNEIIRRTNTVKDKTSPPLKIYRGHISYTKQSPGGSTFKEDSSLNDEPVKDTPTSSTNQYRINIQDKQSNKSPTPYILQSQDSFHLNELRQKVESLEKEKSRIVEDYQRQLQQALRDKENKQQNCTKLENANSKLDQEREKLNLKVQQHDLQIKKLLQKIKDYEDETTELHQKLNEQQSKALQIENETATKNLKEVKKLQEQQENLEKEYNENKSRLREKENKVRSLEDEVEQLNENIEKMRGQLVECRQSNLTTQSQIEQNLKEKLNKMDKEIEDIRKESRKKQSTIDDLESKFEELQQSHSQLRFQHDKVVHEHQKAQDQLNKVQESERNLKKEMEMVNSNSRQKNQQTQNELDQLKRQIEELELEKKSLEKRVKEKEKKISNLESKIVDLEEDKLTQFREYQEDLESKKNFYDLSVVELKKRISEMEDKNRELRGQKDILNVPLHSQNSLTPRSPSMNNKSPNRSPIKSPLVESLRFRKLSQDDLNQGFQLKINKMENDVDEHQLLNQIKTLQEELMSKEQESYNHIQNLKEENTRLLKQIKQDKSNPRGGANDREVAKLSVENEFLKKQIEELNSRLNGGSPHKSKHDSILEENESEMMLLKEKLKALREENINYTQQLKSSQEEQQNLEKNLVEAKMNWASLDMENDELALKLKQKNEQLKVFSSQLTTLEIELVRTKQDLGEALNQVNAYEITEREMSQQQESLVFERERESNVESVMSQKTDGGKKASKADQLKNFLFKKTSKN